MATLMTTTAPTSTARPERAARTISPRVDIYETDKAFVLLADMPGVGAPLRVLMRIDGAALFKSP